MPAGSGRSAFIDVADVGAAVVHCLLGKGHTGQGYTLTGPEALDFAQVASTLPSTLGRPIRYRPVSVPRCVLERWREGKPLALCLVMAALYTLQRVGQAATTTETVRQLLGRAPTDFATYARQRFPASGAS